MLHNDSSVSGSRPRLFRLGVAIFAVAIVAATAATRVTAQGAPPTGVVAGRNVNMVSGTGWPDGDPFLQRQNEPSVAASTRNPLHLLGGSNDYRTVDLPGLPNGSETGDAWLGVFKSFDGGQRWRSTLLPGYPQDGSPAGLASPLHGYDAGADPVVRAGTNGLFYYAGIVFNRGTNAPSRVFVARFIDNNNKENGDPVAYLGASAIASNSGQNGAFIDKPWIAVDVPRAGARTCRVSTPGPNGTTLTQTIPAGTVYLAYSVITGTGSTLQSAVMFSSSNDCGVTWSRPVQISDPAARVNQGSTIAIDPVSGAVFVTWRQFGLNGQSDAITVARSSRGGRGFGALRTLRKIAANHTEHEVEGWLKREREEDERSGGRETESGREKEAREKNDRAKGDGNKEDREPGSVPGQGNAFGRGSVSISTAGTIAGTFDQPTADDQFRTNAYPTTAVDALGRAYVAWTERGQAGFDPDQARIVMSTSRDGVTWSTPKVVEDPADQYNAAQKLPGHQLMPTLAFAGGKLVLAFYDLREDISDTFSQFVNDGGVTTLPRKRHTVDIRVTMADPADAPAFEPSVQVSQYLETVRPQSGIVQQLQYNPPNLPLFKLGTAPFMGDYIDITPAPAFVQTSGGQWVYNTTSSAAPVFHLVWTDNRDVRPPRDGDWTKYTPPLSKFTGQTCEAGFTASRNQNIYTSRITRGLLTGSPGNSKQLSPTVPRGFVVFAQNGTALVKTFRFEVASQPVGGRASFTQFLADPLVTYVDVNVAPRSSVSRTVYVTSTDPRASVTVNVTEIDAPQGSSLIGGLSGVVVLNPDISNPDISNPDISNPNISNPNISNAEVYNPNISNPNISNPNISNPDISNPDISNPDISNVLVLNPDISNPNISNPDISNPDISNPDISNPNISNPDISNGALTDITWTITNTGNTTGTFNVDLFAKNATLPSGIKTQLIVYKQYQTPTSDGCALMVQTDSVLVANIANPVFKPVTDPVTKPDPGNPNISNATLWLEPGASAKITLRVVDTQPNDPIVFNPATQVTPTVTSEAYNVTGLATPNTPPPTPPAGGTPPPNTQPDTVNIPVLAFAAPVGNTQLGQPIPAFSVVATGLASGVEIPVTVAIATGGSLGGTTTRLTAGGVALFNDITVDHAVNGLVLVASSSPANALPIYSNALTVSKITLTVTLSNMTQVYTGSPLSPAVQTSPVAVPVVLTGAPQTNAGNYGVVATVDPNNAMYQGSAGGTFEIHKAPAPVVLGNLTQIYTGAPLTPTATTTPAGLGVTWTGAPQTSVGSYPITATVSDPNYQGSASGTFVINPAPLPSGPSDSFWHADGDGIDSVSGYTATLMGGAQYAPGRVGNAFRFTNQLAGSNQYVLIGDQPGLRYTTALTIAAWINPVSDGLTTMGAEGGIIVNKEDSYEIARFSDGSIRFAFNNSAVGWGWIATGATAPLNTWSHVAVTFDNGTVKTYLNGSLVSTITGIANGTITDYGRQVRIGGRQYSDWVDSGNYRQNFDGLIDEVGLYNRALSDFELRLMGGSTSSTTTAGGLGGSPWGPVDCQAGSVATAFRGSYDTAWAPQAIVRTELWCSVGTLTSPASLAGLTQPPTGSGTIGTQIDYGAALSCPADKVIVGIFGTTASSIVKTLGVTCANPDGSSPVSLGPAGYGAGTPFTLSCPAGQAAVGMEGRQGWNMDQIALRCR